MTEASTNKRKASDLDPKTPTTPPTHPQEDDRNEGYREQNIASCNLALDYYNKKHHTKYEVVEDKSMAGNYFANHLGFWTHCCFYAKDSSIKQFFAEIHVTCLSKPAITCMILEGKTSVGCEYCRCSFIIHPVGGYQVGYPNYSLHASRSISDDDKEPWMDPNLDKETVEKDGVLETETPAIPPTLQQDWSGTPSTTPTHQQEDWSEGTPGYPPTEEETKDIEAHHRQSVRSANIALDYYNKKNNTLFELVEDEHMHSNAFFNNDGVWIHCSFNAKESLIKQFFAELHCECPSMAVTACEILEGKTSLGCVKCYTVIHPVGGYLAGCPSPSDSPRASGSIPLDDRWIVM